jgi:hypothetical protein
MAKHRAPSVGALAAVKNLGNGGAPRVLDPITTPLRHNLAPIVKVNSNDPQ